jgi:two-component system NtrC family sensor kinase
LARLILRRDGNVVQEIDISKESLVLGRDPSCDVVLDDKIVSRRHARLITKPDSVSIEDLDSRNGTYVSGKRIIKHTIAPGDAITIGGYRITFEGIPVPAGRGRRERSKDHPTETAIISALDAKRIGTGEDIKEGAVTPEAVAKRLSTLYDLGQKLCGQLGLAEIARSFEDVLFEVFPRADRAVMLIENRQTREFEPFAVRGRDGAAEDVTVSRAVVSTVVEGKSSVLCTDTGTDSRFKDSVSLQDLRIKSIMCVPLMVGEHVFGMVELDSGGGGMAFNEDDLRVLTGLAAQVSIAIENGRLYDEVEQSRRLAAIGQTVSGVAHCVKNVLNGMEGGLFIARRGLEARADEKIAKGWEMLERNSSFLKTLVLDMLDYSKNRPPDYQEITLDALFEEIMAFVEGRAAEGGINLTLSLDEAIGPVHLDAVRMKRALLNIVANAIEATPEGGRVEISAIPLPPDVYVISIADTGGGIPKDKVATIFEPFFSTKGSKGTGLGLPVTKKIIEEHGGRIEIDSAVGEGTTFRITLPSRRQDATRRIPS